MRLGTALFPVVIFSNNAFAHHPAHEAAISLMEQGG
jgi:hypothetical protein